MPKDNVVILQTVTKLDIPVDRVLESAKKVGLESIVIIGELENGEEYFASSAAGSPEVLWLLARAQKKLLEIVD